MEQPFNNQCHLHRLATRIFERETFGRQSFIKFIPLAASAS